LGRVALPVKALKAGQESYWLDQIARNREEYFSGRGESPGRFVGSAAATAGLDGTASPEQVRAMFQGLDPATGEQRCAPLLRADPRSKLAAGPLLDALKSRTAEHSLEDLEALADSKALKSDVRSVQAACRLGGARRVKVETVERLCRKVLGRDPRELYGDGFDKAWQHRGKRVNERVQAFDHCFSSPKSVSLLAAGASPQTRRLLADGRAEALQVAIGYLERHGLGVRRDHNGTDRYQAVGGLVAVAFEHRMSRAGDPNNHTHVLVQNAAQGPDGRWTALDSDRLYAHLMAADHLYLAAERAALTERLGVRWEPVDERSGAAEIQGLDDRTLIERFSKRSEQIDQWLDTYGLSGIRASSAAAVATRAPKDHAESEESVHARWAAELAEQGVGERQLAEVCSGGQGRPASRTELDAALDELSGPDGLTGQASTFTRTDVVDALAKRLPVAPSAREALTQVEEAADRFLEERAVRVRRDSRLGIERFSTPELLALERHLVDSATERTGEGRAVVRSEVVRQVLDRHSTAGETKRPWSGTSPRAAPAWRWWWGGRAAARPGRWGWPGRRSSWTATRSTVAPRPGSRPLGWPRKASLMPARSTGCCTTSAVAGRSWTTGRCWWWMRPPWSAPESSPPSSGMPSGQARRWCWSATTASSRPSPPVAASAPSACGWAPANSPSTGGRS
jgi:conjugative relaxase-like TrwC/TraI family protein